MFLSHLSSLEMDVIGSFHYASLALLTSPQYFLASCIQFDLDHKFVYQW